MLGVDSQSTAHYGAYRGSFPGVGTEPEVDAQLSAHMGFLAVNILGALFVDDTFCIVKTLDEDSQIALVVGDTFCVVLVDTDEDTRL